MRNEVTRDICDKKRLGPSGSSVKNLTSVFLPQGRYRERTDGRHKEFKRSPIFWKNLGSTIFLFTCWNSRVAAKFQKKRKMAPSSKKPFFFFLFFSLRTFVCFLLLLSSYLVVVCVGCEHSYIYISTMASLAIIVKLRAEKPKKKKEHTKMKIKGKQKKMNGPNAMELLLTTSKGSG